MIERGGPPSFPMAHDWTELFILDGGAPPTAVAEEAEPEHRRGFFRRLRENIGKTRAALGAEIQATLFDDARRRDLGAPGGGADHGRRRREHDRAGRRRSSSRRPTSGELEGGPALTARLTELLAGIARPQDDARIDLRHDPTVMMVAGVNGTGKTTTIGKLAWHLRETLGQTVAARRRRHVPRRRGRAARGMGAARRLRVRQGPAGLRPRLGRVRRRQARARARRRRRDRRHRRAPAHPGRPDGRAGEDPPRDRAPDARRARTRRC